MAIQYCLINGTLTPYETASIHVSDIGFLRGYGAFDYFHFRKKQPFFLEDYLERFARTCKVLKLVLPYSLSEIRAQIFQLIEANDLPEGGIRLHITGGYQAVGFGTPTPNFLIIQFPIKVHPEWTYEKGVKIISIPFQRELPEAKTTNYLTALVNQDVQDAAGAYDMVYHDQGVFTESARNNFFIVDQQNRIVTCPDRILLGVTRKNLIKVAESLGFELVYRFIRTDELDQVKEAFISSSTRGAMPVIQIDDQRIGDGKVGPVAKAIHHAFEQAVDTYINDQLAKR
ncbi:MAG: aminotransferase class IV [Bacteroidota bacterium]